MSERDDDATAVDGVTAAEWAARFGPRIARGEHEFGDMPNGPPMSCIQCGGLRFNDYGSMSLSPGWQCCGCGRCFRCPDREDIEIDDVELDSPPFTPEGLDRFKARGFKRVNRMLGRVLPTDSEDERVVDELVARRTNGMKVRRIGERDEPVMSTVAAYRIYSTGGYDAIAPEQHRRTMAHLVERLKAVSVEDLVKAMNRHPLLPGGARAEAVRARLIEELEKL